MSRSRKFTDRDFQKLAIKVNQNLIDNEGKIGNQQEQVELVMKLERNFIESLKRHSRGREVYGLFIDFILKDLGNILSARPYFREPSNTFTKFVTPAIKGRNSKKLMDFNGNFMLIKFIVDHWGEELPKQSADIYKKLVTSRDILICNNIPLAINRAKLFYRKVPKSHFTLLDFISICVHGLISGIDKYYGTYTTTWRSVCIGRMVGFLIENYSKSLIRMFPSDKKILYRANSLKYKLKIDNIVQLTEAVNASFEQDKLEKKHVPKLPITKEYLLTLMNSASPVSADSALEDDSDSNFDSNNDYTGNTYSYASESQDEVRDEVEKIDLMRKVTKASNNLLLVEKKVIRLKGVDL